MSITNIKILGITLISAIILIMLALFYSFQNYQEKEKQLSLNHQADVIAHLLQKNIYQQLKMVRQFKLYLTTNNKISLEKFMVFSKSYLSENSYIKNIEWGVNISRESRQDFEAELQSIYKLPITITEKNINGKINSAKQRDRYLAIKYVFPFRDNSKAIGFDPSVGKGSLNNLSLAVTSHKATLSGKIRLVQDYLTENNKDYIAFYIPVFSQQNNLIGFLTLILDIEKMIDSVLNDSQLNMPSASDIRLSDITYSMNKLLFQSPSFGNWNKAQLSATNITLANRLWKLEIQYNSGSIVRNILSYHNFIVLIGLIITIAILYGFILLLNRIVQSEKKVVYNNLDINDSHTMTSLLSLTFETHQAIAITNSNGNILRVNKAFCHITGYSEPEVIGENPRILSSGRQSNEFYQNMWHQLLSKGQYTGEIWNRRKNGEVYPEMQTITAIKNLSGVITHYVSVFTDITQQKRHEEQDKNLSFYDPLTLLPNRRLFMDRLDNQLAESIRYKALGAVLIINIDGFDKINKKLTYHIGDDLLVALSSRLQKTLRNTDTVARIEGDEFAVLIPVRPYVDNVITEQVLLVAEKLQQIFNKPFVVDDNIIQVGISIGISLIIPDSVSGTVIIRQARIAMYKAKIKEGNKIIFDSKIDSVLS